MYLLDTCFLSELKKRNPVTSVVRTFEALLPGQIYISVISIGEIAVGIEMMEPCDRRNQLELWLSGLQQQFDREILPIDQDVMMVWSNLNATLRRQGYALPGFDGLLAATALHHKLSVITRNTDDFIRTGVSILNPWNHA